MVSLPWPVSAWNPWMQPLISAVIITKMVMNLYRMGLSVIFVPIMARNILQSVEMRFVPYALVAA